VPVPKDGLVTRSELCDGERTATYARMTLRGSDPTAATAAEGIEHLKSDLVASVTPAEPMLQPNYWN
jgi:hypothetical protein